MTHSRDTLVRHSRKIHTLLRHSLPKLTQALPLPRKKEISFEKVYKELCLSHQTTFDTQSVTSESHAVFAMPATENDISQVAKCPQVALYET